uniref:Copper transport protein n=1 Tax=Heterorhabditis bacteriophora TaxID=37862 RepID=A0A1I7WRC2_HETBA
MSQQNASDMMSMWIHFREKEMILFPFWKTSTLSGLHYTYYDLNDNCSSKYRFLKQRRQFSNRSQSPLGGGDNISQESVSFAPLLQLSGYFSFIYLLKKKNFFQLYFVFRLTKRLFTSYRILQGALYGIQALLAYVLMLIVMTFNGNLIISIVIGEAVGYFLFTGNPLFDSAVADCC